MIGSVEDVDVIVSVATLSNHDRRAESTRFVCECGYERRDHYRLFFFFIIDIERCIARAPTAAPDTKPRT